MAAPINFLIWPGPPAAQLVADLRAARSAILVGFVGGLVSPPYLERCLCDYDSPPCAHHNNGVLLEQRCYQLASFVVAMLGVALLAVHMAFSAALVVSPALPPGLRWMIWITKVLTGGTLQYGLNIFHLCLRMWCASFMLVFA